MGAQSDRLRCEVCQNLFLSPMNTGLLRYAVGTVLTVYGIETYSFDFLYASFFKVGTVLTVYGIETINTFFCLTPCSIVGTVLTVYGIETHNELYLL